jgi:hypothetical protein
MKIFGCFLVLCCLLAATPAVANDLTIFGGYQHPGKLTLQRVGESAPTLTDPANFGAFGLRVGSRFFEQTISYSPNFVESETKAVILGSNFILHLPLPRVRPYGTIGLGTVFTKGDGIADVGTKFAINYGGGIKANVAGPVGVRFDARNYTIPSFETEGLSIQDQTLNVFEISIGLLFSWGGR